MLSDLEENGIKIAVAYRTGQLKSFDCSMCSAELRNIRNCDMNDSDVPVLFHPELGQLYTCPLRMIPATVVTFLDEMDYYTKYPSAYNIPYQKANPKYWEAVKLYDKLISQFEQNEHEKALSKMSSK